MYASAGLSCARLDIPRCLCVLLLIEGPDQGRPFGAQALHRGTAETDRIYRPDAGRANSEQNAQGPGEVTFLLFSNGHLKLQLNVGYL